MTFYICVQNNTETKVHYLLNSSEECHDLNQRTALPPGGTQGETRELSWSAFKNINWDQVLIFLGSASLEFRDMITQSCNCNNIGLADIQKNPHTVDKAEVKWFQSGFSFGLRSFHLFEEHELKAYSHVL